jgi:chromosome segregation ATPase
MRLRQQLVHARAEIADLQEELQEKNNLYLNAIRERDAGIEKLNNAKKSILDFEQVVKRQVDKAMDKERALHKRNLVDLEKYKDMFQAGEDAQLRLKKKNKELEEKYSSLRDEDAERSRKGGADGERPNEKSKGKIKQLTDRLSKKEREVEELTKRVNYLQGAIEDFMAENTQLRVVAGVPANYGVDRERVKLLDKEKIDDFKKLIKVLQEDNYRLEAERASLKHELRKKSLTWKRKDDDN